MHALQNCSHSRTRQQHGDAGASRVLTLAAIALFSAIWGVHNGAKARTLLARWSGQEPAVGAAHHCYASMIATR